LPFLGLLAPPHARPHEIGREIAPEMGEIAPEIAREMGEIAPEIAEIASEIAAHRAGQVSAMAVTLCPGP
jgi:hypothetical protein